MIPFFVLSRWVFSSHSERNISFKVSLSKKLRTNRETVCAFQHSNSFGLRPPNLHHCPFENDWLLVSFVTFSLHFPWEPEYLIRNRGKYGNCCYNWANTGTCLFSYFLKKSFFRSRKARKLVNLHMFLRLRDKKLISIPKSFFADRGKLQEGRYKKANCIKQRGSSIPTRARPFPAYLLPRNPKQPNQKLFFNRYFVPSLYSFDHAKRVPRRHRMIWP